MQRLFSTPIQPDWSKIPGRVIFAAAMLLGITTAWKVWIDADPTYDAWYYHLPFAARLWDIVPQREYEFENKLQALFQGFPLLAEWLQGLFWKITGRVEAAAFVSYGSLLACAFFCGRELKSQASLAFLALISVPLIQAHAVSNYIDLPAAAFLAMGILETFLLFESGKPAFKRLLSAGIFLAVGANIKHQAVPIAALVWLAAALRYFLKTPREERKSPALELLILTAISILMFYKPLENLLLFGNPFYPVRFQIGGHILNSTIPAGEPIAFYGDTPQPLMWLVSVFETTRSPFEKFVSHGRLVAWEVAQGAQSAEKSRMGGYFGLYVIFQLICLAVFAKKAGASGRRAAVLFLSMSLITACMPLSRELRYYMYWIIVLIGLNLWLLGKLEAIRMKFSTVALNVYRGGVCFFLVFMIHNSEGAYVFPKGMSLNLLFNYYGINDGIDRLEKEGRACVVNKRPNSFMYAHYFHPERRPYALYAAESEAACKAYWERTPA